MRQGNTHTASPEGCIDRQPQLIVERQQVDARVGQTRAKAERRAGASALENALRVVLLGLARVVLGAHRQLLRVKPKRHDGGESVKVVLHALRKEARHEAVVRGARERRRVGLAAQ